MMHALSLRDTSMLHARAHDCVILHHADKFCHRLMQAAALPASLSLKLILGCSHGGVIMPQPPRPSRRLGRFFCRASAAPRRG